MRCLNCLLLLSCLFLPALGIGCLPKICGGNDKNELVDCDGKYCGTYKGLRVDGQLAEAVDLRCTENSDIFAPFDGNLSYWRPYGGDKAYDCANEGAKLRGTGQWQGVVVYIAPLLLDRYSGSVTKGQRLGISKDLQCVHPNKPGYSQPHIRLHLFKVNSFTDPTYHLSDCMCTGQICETNANNELVSKPFKYDERYGNVRGWDIKCDMPKEGVEPHAPEVYSPIEAKWIGRRRLYDLQGQYSGCDNNGIVMTGAGTWEGFEVVMYNVHYLPGILGHQRVVQGQPIGNRLNCTSSPDSIFMEVRYHGDVVDISDLINANVCKKPSFLDS